MKKNRFILASTISLTLLLTNAQYSSAAEHNMNSRIFGFNSISNVSPLAELEYQFGESEFKNYVWLKDGVYFKNPSALDVEIITDGPFRAEVVDSNGVVKDSVTFDRDYGPNRSWKTIYFGGYEDGFYRVRLVSADGKTQKIKQGVLYYYRT